MHRDIKLENIILQEDESGILFCKLADFGWACKYFSEKRSTLCGTPECIFIFKN